MQKFIFAFHLHFHIYSRSILIKLYWFYSLLLAIIKLLVTTSSCGDDQPESYHIPQDLGHGTDVFYLSTDMLES